MDLGSVDTIASSNEGATLVLLHPKTGEETDIQIVLYGPDSDVVRRLKREQSERTLEALRKPGSKPKLEELDRAASVFLAGATKGWANVERDGKPYPFTFENAVDLYQSFPWIREQVDRFIGDRRHFIRG